MFANPIESYIVQWLELAFRWSHLIVGIAWIGASFYFNWLENRLERSHRQSAEIEGDLWAIHGGGFYHVSKYQVAPDQLPSTLHWFKWEAYATWFTGLVLLVLVFYIDARVYLLDPSVNALDPWQGVVIGILVLAVSWVLYDLLCRSPVAKQSQWTAFIVFVYFSILTFVLCQVFSGRGAYIHIGAAIGTIMVLNVMAVIIPSQKSLVNAMKTGGEKDASLGAAALMRSRHNNYFTLPVLFIMIAGHYPSTFGSDWNWAVLIGLALVGILVRHYFNVRHLPGPKWWLLAVAFAGLVAIAALSVPKSILQSSAEQTTSMDAAREIIHKRCTVCHSQTPVQAGFQTAPGGVILDTDEHIFNLSSRIFTTAVATRSMPIGNLTQMTEEERTALSSWYAGLNDKALNTPKTN